MAIDQEIQRKVDAYRGNPQQLMQRYQQNQQLVDLLALQKLKSEKEAAARDMQMQMQQQPQTIKQQREAELLNMTKQEVMQQTQGVLQQRQAQQQQNMQQVAQQGLGALANQRPAPAPQGQPMPRMAAGGIVSFQPGGSVDGPVTYQQWLGMSRSERRRAGLPESFIGGQNYFNRFGVGMGLNDPETGERIRREPSTGRRGRREEEPPAPIETADPIARLVDQEEDAGTAPQGAMSMMGQGPMSTTAAMQPPRGGVAALLGEQAQPQMSVPEGGIPTVTEQPPAEPTFAEQAQGITDNMRTSIPRDGMGIGGGGADAAMQRGFATADAYTGRAEKAGRYADMEAEMRALDEEMYDPREERRDQLKAFLAGTANTTNFGSTMAGGTLASLNLRDRQKSARRERLQDIFEMAERGMTLDATLANGGLDLGRTMYSEAMQNQRTALSAAASMRTAELQAEVRRAELEYKRLEADRSFGLQESELAIEQARNEALAAQSAAENDTRRFGAVSLALDRIQDQEAKIREHVVENSQLPALQDALLMAVDEDEAAQLEAAIAAEEARVNIQAESIFDQMGGVEARDLLAAELLSFTGTGATMLSMDDVAGIEQLDEEE